MDCRAPDSPHGEGLHELHTNFDNWICRFEARLVSRSSIKIDYGDPPIAAPQFNLTAPNQEKRKTPPSSLLQEIIDGKDIAQLQNRIPFSIIETFLNLFKGCDDFTHYDYVLLTLLNETGRKHFYKLVRSKI